MTLKKIKFEKYIKKNFKFIKNIIPEITKEYEIIIVIPVYNELDFFSKTLKTISSNTPELLGKTLILSVINNPESIDKNSEVFKNNSKLLYNFTKNNYLPSNIDFHWIDCCTPGNGLEGKGGVGVARKIGMDSILQYLDFEKNPIICSLDADTLVDSNYLLEVKKYFSNNKNFCATVSFQHLDDGVKKEFNIIQDYEYYLKHYVNMLRYAGSPYAYHSIGSAMVFTAEGYILSGGMKVNQAGEDFYFLQNMRKITKIGEVDKTKVYQSCRASDRVPFGTGPTVKNSISGKQITLYNHNIFTYLKQFLESSENWIMENEASNIDNFFERLDNKTVIFLKNYSFEKVWPKIEKNNIKINSEISEFEARNKLLWCFNIWFDAFKTLKYIHYLERTYPEEFPRISIEQFKKNFQEDLWNIQNL